MLDHFWTSNEALEFYSDRAGGTVSQTGFGIYFRQMGTGFFVFRMGKK
jgi:hypothetical protein